MKIHLKMSSVKQQPLCPGEDEIIHVRKGGPGCLFYWLTSSLTEIRSLMKFTPHSFLLYVVGHVILVAITGTTILVSYLSSQVTATHVKLTPCNAEYILKNIKIYLHFLPFLSAEMRQLKDFLMENEDLFILVSNALVLITLFVVSCQRNTAEYNFALHYTIWGCEGLSGFLWCCGHRQQR